MGLQVGRSGSVAYPMLYVAPMIYQSAVEILPAAGDEDGFPQFNFHSHEYIRPLNSPYCERLAALPALLQQIGGRSLSQRPARWRGFQTKVSLFAWVLQWRKRTPFVERRAPRMAYANHLVLLDMSSQRLLIATLIGLNILYLVLPDSPHCTSTKTW